MLYHSIMPCACMMRQMEIENINKQRKSRNSENLKNKNHKN